MGRSEIKQNIRWLMVFTLGVCSVPLPALARTPDGNLEIKVDRLVDARQTPNLEVDEHLYDSFIRHLFDYQNINVEQHKKHDGKLNKMRDHLFVATSIEDQRPSIDYYQRSIFYGK
jgi:hypothetical protein